jgi:hypothetical protein
MDNRQHKTLIPQIGKQSSCNFLGSLQAAADRRKATKTRDLLGPQQLENTE